MSKLGPLDQWEETLAKHLLLLLGWSGSQLPLKVLPLSFGLAMLGKVEVAMLIEDKTNAT